MLRAATFLVLSLALVGCVTQNAPSGSNTGVTSTRITMSKLPPSVNNMTAYELVQRYKPQWLRNRRNRTGLTSTSTLKVYLDNDGPPFGDVYALEKIDASSVTYIEYFGASEAQRRFGNGNLAGAIYVDTGPTN